MLKIEILKNDQKILTGNSAVKIKLVQTGPNWLFKSVNSAFEKSENYQEILILELEVCPTP